MTSLIGAPEDVARVMAWIITELALSSWPDYLHVTLVGFGDRLAGLDPERVDVIETFGPFLGVRLGCAGHSLDREIDAFFDVSNQCRSGGCDSGGCDGTCRGAGIRAGAPQLHRGQHGTHHLPRDTPARRGGGRLGCRDLALTPSLRGAPASKLLPEAEKLGTNSADKPHLPASTDGNLALGAGVLVDWNLFQRLQRCAATFSQEGVGDLAAALKLVRGRPVEDIPVGRYGWVAESYVEHDIPPAVIDAAHALVRHCLDGRRPDEARAAACAAQLVDRYDERPWRDLMIAEHAMGNHGGVRSLLQDLLRLVDADGDAITEETSDRIARLRPNF